MACGLGNVLGDACLDLRCSDHSVPQTLRAMEMPMNGHVPESIHTNIRRNG